MEWTAATSRGPLADIDGFRGTVLAVFPGSVYVTGSSPDLLVVHDSSHGHTPTSLLVDRSSLAGARPGDAVNGRAGYLRAGDLIIDVRHAAVWTPRVGPSRAWPATGLEQSRRVLRERVPTMSSGVLRIMDRLLVALGVPLDDAVERALMAIIGLGAGLTPSGDDAVVGMLGVLHRVCEPHAADAHLDLLRRTVPAMLARTTPISAHYLRLALRGAFSERLTVLLDTVADGPEHGPLRRSRLECAIDGVLAVGASSGADALAGVSLTLDMVADPARFHCVKDVA